jgi:hypothetical protein
MSASTIINYPYASKVPKHKFTAPFMLIQPPFSSFINNSSSVTMNLSHALQLNNEGVNLLLQNRDSEAVLLFTNSLNEIKQLVVTGEVPNKGSDISFRSPLFVHDATHTVPGLQDLACFIYGNALTFSSETVNRNMPSEDQSNHLASSVLLNVALVYHRTGLRGNQAALEKAERLYDMVCQLLVANDICHGTALLVKAAAINNLAQIRHHRGDYAFALERFKYLGSLFACFGENLHHTKGLQAVYLGMLLNVLLITPPGAAPAA